MAVSHSNVSNASQPASFSAKRATLPRHNTLQVIMPGGQRDSNEWISNTLSSMNLEKKRTIAQKHGCGHGVESMAIWASCHLVQQHTPFLVPN